ncbi:MAG: alcohol dehydrogenase, partial [Thermoactinospora sp.]|nr:alcohol dehydrogenase [Thermoactinospora sp.]
MRALTVSGDAFVLAERPAADPLPGQALVEVHHVIVTGRDAVHAPAVLGEGGVWGFEAAGVVVRQAADGTGPAAGARVVGLGDRPGAWAELAAFGAGDLAVVPE